MRKTKIEIITELVAQGLTNKQIGELLQESKLKSYTRKIIKQCREKYNKNLTTSLLASPRRELFLADLHLPYEDPYALNIALTYAKTENIDTIVLGGDIVDFMSVSFWDRELTNRDLNKERRYAIQVLTKIRQTFPKATIYYIQGNHEERLERYLLRKAPELGALDELSVKNLLQLEKLNITYINNREIINKTNQPFKIETLYHLHGHEIRTHWTIITVARTLFQRSLENVIFGHFHITQEWIQRKINNDVMSSSSVGCLCKLSAPYSIVNNWNHGFAIIEYKKNGQFTTRNYKIRNGEVL